MPMEKQIHEIVDYQKRALQLMFDLAATFQTYAESQAQCIMARASWIPDETKGLIRRWMESLAPPMETIKNAIETGFDHLPMRIPIPLRTPADRCQGPSAEQLHRILKALNHEKR